MTHISPFIKRYICTILICVIAISCDDESSQKSSLDQYLSHMNGDLKITDLKIIDRQIIADQIIADQIIADQTLDSSRPLDPNQIDHLIPLIAQNQCRIFRDCCEDQALKEYFFSIQNSSSYSDEIKAKLPPKKAFGDDCESIMTEVLSIAPFGDWVKGVKENLIQYLPENAITCLDQMKNASCGISTYDVLFDSTCFSLVAPGGGEIQRKAFDRIGREGSTCFPIRDGIGSSFYGTCDPFNAFCCIADEEGKCLPGSPDQRGTCKSVSSIGQPCQSFPIQLCQTGLNCDPIESKCLAESTAPLANGDLCYDQFNLLGVCLDSYCDVSGSNHCEPLIEDGQACASSYTCRSQACNAGTCGPILFCTGKNQ